MATQSKKTGFPEFFADTQSADNLRRQFIEAPMDAAGQSALGAGIELANLLNILPGAFVASQERELERLKKSGIENDPRVAALETSIEQAGVLQTMAQRGQARIQRGLVAFAGGDKVFHGFVSDAQLTPLKGLTVRLTGNKTLSATTDDDGYFSISLGKKSKKQQEDAGEKRGQAGKGSLLQRITDLMASPGIAPLASGTESAEGEDEGRQVEILQKGKLLHTDPATLAVDQGSVYREYVIADTEPFSAADLKKFNPAAAAKAARAATSTESRKKAPRPAKSKKAEKK